MVLATKMYTTVLETINGKIKSGDFLIFIARGNPCSHINLVP